MVDVGRWEVNGKSAFRFESTGFDFEVFTIKKDFGQLFIWCLMG